MRERINIGAESLSNADKVWCTQIGTESKSERRIGRGENLWKSVGSKA